MTARRRTAGIGYGPPMAQSATLISDRLKVAAAQETVPFRQAPHNLEAEQALLGAILVNNESMDRVSAFLEPHHFFDPLHQQIY
jgi:replicative DNA helicase